MKKLLYKILTVIMSVLLMGTMLVGCGGGSSSSEITVWWPGTDKEMAAILSAKADYEAANQGVTVNVIGQNSSDFYSAYMQASGGGTAPDVAYIDHVYIQTLAYYGYLADLGALGLDETKSNFIDTLWKPNLYRNKLYALPMSCNVLVTVYNKTLIAEAQGTTTDNIVLPTNLDDFVVLAEQIKALGNDKYAITLPAGNDTNIQSMAVMTYLSYLSRCGGDGVLSSNLKTSKLNSNASKMAAMTIQTMGQYAPALYSESGFEKGNIAFIEMGPWKMSDYTSYSSRYEWEIGYAPIMPFIDGQDNSSTIGLYSLVVSKASANQEIAADFVKFVTTNDKYQLEFATVQNLIPTTKTGVQDEFYSGDEWQVFVNQLDNVVVRPGSPIWTDIASTISEFTTSLIRQEYVGNAINEECEAINTNVQNALNDFYN